jgi:subtilisin family serine protease
LLISKNAHLLEEQNKIIDELDLVEVPERSKYLTRYRYLQVRDPRKANAYALRDRLEKQRKVVGEVLFETMPMVKPLAATIPNDTHWANQWNMTQINAPNAWDLTTGSAAVVICILDEGCDLTHPDLQFSGQGINLGTMMPTGAPTGNHGTACAGIAAASFNNNQGVAGLAGSCLILPVAFDAWSDVEVANGINYATTEGAQVISMSFGWDPWNPAIIDPEIQNAAANDIVMCVATHNDNAAIRYPATNPLVMACGASSTDDGRKTPMSPDGECWGSNFGDVVYGGTLTGVSVVAPGVLCPTTDIQGNDGYYDGTGPINNWACVNYPNPGSADGDYIFMFDGTSAATPHVAGLAGLLRSAYPSLTAVDVRRIIERTAAKAGPLAYGEVAGFPHGTRNQQMGYGRIDAFWALDYADVMVKDWSGDAGVEPSTPPSGNFWTFSDVVVRITDDDVFNPDNPAQSKHVERGQTNYIYVRVTNIGPNQARNIAVNVRLTPWVGLQFVYPIDWTAIDAMHVAPTAVTTTFATIASGSSVIAKFSISAAQVEELYGWQYDHPWHPCLLAEVSADNDYAFSTSDLSFGNIVLRKNNVAQRNLSVIDVLASPGAAIAFPFVAGNHAIADRRLKLRIDRSKLPRGALARLSLDEDGRAFPRVDFTRRAEPTQDHGVLLLDRTRIRTRLGCCEGILVLERGSRFLPICDDDRLEIVGLEGGKMSVLQGRRYVELAADVTEIELSKAPNAVYPLSVELRFPGDIDRSGAYTLSVAQLDERGRAVGGADAMYRFH